MVVGKWIDNDTCTACSACINICPADALSMVEDDCGFFQVKVGPTCIECNKCKNICPIVNILDKKNEVTLYAAKTKNESIRFESTSGGIFSEVAKYVLLNGGTVFGAAYTSDFMVAHTHITKLSGLGKLRQSKYVQSNIGLSFRQVKLLLDNGQHVLFVGTPCQIAGLYNYLGKEYDNLILVDFICRGSNSNKAYRKWLLELQQKYESTVSRVWFKNKCISWNQFSTRVEFQNHKAYSQDRDHDCYIQGYIHYNLFIRKNCEQCTFKGIYNRISDITLGDYWGLANNLDDNLGTSVVLINSKKGESLLNEIRDEIIMIERPIDEMLKKNPMAIKSVVRNSSS